MHYHKKKLVFDLKCPLKVLKLSFILFFVFMSNKKEHQA